MSYTKRTWANGDLITQESMNNIENGIFTAHDEIEILKNNTITGGSNNASDITITDTEDNFTSTNVEGALAEVSSQINDITNVADLAQTGNNIYIKDSNGNKVGNGITISTSSSSSPSSSSCEITQDFINSNKYKLTWLGERFTAPSDYVAWGGSMRYEPKLGKFVQWLYCAPAHMHSTAQLYVVYIDKNTMVADEPIHCVYYDTDGITQLSFDNEAGVSVRCLEDGTYQLIKGIKEGKATCQYKFNSTDYGKTWIKEEQISPPSGVGGFDDIVTLSNGRLITSYGGPVFYSDDNGLNWTISTPTTCGGNYEAEANFLELEPGTVMAIARYSMSGGTAGDGTPDPAIVAYSFDYGTTWTSWKKSKTILDMNAIGCQGIIHDGFVELFVASRWYDNITKYTETGKHGAVYQYTATIQEALDDNFTNNGIIYYSPGTAQEVMAPNFAIDDNNEMLFSIAQGGGSVTCTKFYAKGTKTNYFSMIDDENKSSFASYSNIKIDELIEALTQQVKTLQYALSQIPGSGVEEPAGSLVWTKTFDADSGHLFNDDANPFSSYVANASHSTKTDSFGNNIVVISKTGVGGLPSVTIPVSKSNYAIEITVTLEDAYNGFFNKNLFMVTTDDFKYNYIRFYNGSLWVGHATGAYTGDTTYGPQTEVINGMGYPGILTIRMIHTSDGNNELYLKYTFDGVDNIRTKTFNSDELLNTYSASLTEKGFSFKIDNNFNCRQLKFGEWDD